MTKSTISREQLEEWVAQFDEDGGCDATDRQLEALIRQSLAAMDIEPHTDDELSNLLRYSQEATCHSDPNYYCEFQRLATPGLIAGIIRELQERRKADSESVAEVLSNRPGNGTSIVDVALPVGTQLYRHAQPASVVDADDNFYSWFGREWAENYQHNQYTTAAKQMLGVMAESAWKAGRRAAMLQAEPVCTCPSGDGSLRWPCQVHPGSSPVIPDGYVMVPVEPNGDMLAAAQDAYGETDGDIASTLRAAMLAAAPQSPGSEPATVPGKWIPVSEQMPEDRTQVILWDAEIGEVTSGHYSHKTHTFYHCGDAIENEITHWMAPPAAPQEVSDA
ncbi:Eaa1 [Klebsiella pneumoniae]|nr:DUF551 domain-containing protein [Klebsiella pneumoniae]VGA16695.1 Eaa1 [Klebsiella pneumoniae]